MFGRFKGRSRQLLYSHRCHHIFWHCFVGIITFTFFTFVFVLFFFFFFQAEDGIRDLIVTGVQTCALPIWIACVRGTSATIIGSLWNAPLSTALSGSAPGIAEGFPKLWMSCGPVLLRDRKSVV